MRVEFSNWIEAYSRREPRLIFVTGDLGFGALENVRTALGDRFVNAGVSEQNMISMAAALASEGLLPVCYSIAPFAVFRPYEQIRLDVALHRRPVKIVGNGGGYGYGIMGATHHAIEDLAVLSCLPSMRCHVPLCGSDVAAGCEAAFAYPGPAYVRLGYGVWPDTAGNLPQFNAVRRFVGVASPKLTIVGLGPVILSIIEAAQELGQTDVFAVSELPFSEIPLELIESVRASHRMLVVEEHVMRGGLAEYLALRLAKEGLEYRLHHRYALGYPDSRYGSQKWHQQRSGLDPESLRAAVTALST